MRIKLDANALMPVRAHETDAGLDLRTPIAFTIYPQQGGVIDTGVHVEILEGWVGFIKSKSGLMTKCGIVSDGTIDAGYTGSIRVYLHNRGEDEYRFERGDKIAQLVVVPCDLSKIEVVDELTETDRGENGFGSTGR